MEIRELNDALVSVIVPVYNSEKYIAATLDAIIKQDYQEKEIIIVDDGSTDNTYAIIDEYLKNISCISYFKLEKNLGVAMARNKAIERARGRYIAFCDSDDIWEENKLSEQLKLFKNHPGAPFTYTAISYIDEDGKQIKRKRNLKECVSYKYVLRNTIIATSTVIIDRNIVPVVKMPIRKSAEDYSLWLTILKNYGDAYGINEAYTKYRISENSLSSNRMGEVKYFWQVQREDMGIGRVNVFINTLIYIINAIKKHYF
ncbi:glycosyltransferase family 2 protein [Eubacterium sp. MSJ-33]|uniref:glycosyltransferase family 2 protein n=1 Tax=Eubacterium sp. MSJ-33 TaxID=2841528 RepID=UPI001C78205D|nr:glycosyltransferase family 2 protein [Eubacterium sp. MSJ-33]QWT54152.1 glycosyltransferase family 2 protein [Eubacterium sp. MSJ-33]